MRNIIPRDYKYRFDSIIGGVIFWGFSITSFVMSIIPDIKMDKIEFLTKIISISIGVFGIFLIGKDIIGNLKVSKLRKWRKNMLKKNSVVGTIEGIEEEVVREKYTKFLNRRQTGEDASVYYCLVVSYLDPVTGYKKIIKSDQYSEMLKYYLATKDVKVYIDENNEVFIDNLNIRKSIKNEKIEFNNQGESDNLNEYAFYIIDKYTNVINAVGISIFILIVGFMILR